MIIIIPTQIFIYLSIKYFWYDIVLIILINFVFLTAFQVAKFLICSMCRIRGCGIVKSLKIVASLLLLSVLCKVINSQQYYYGNW